MDAGELLGTLNKWAEEDAKISPPGKFQCDFFDACGASAPLPSDGSQTCMSFIGRRYELAENNPKIVIVGLDHGCDDFQTYESRRRIIESEGNFNGHYRGVVRTASAIFGARGDYCATQCMSSNRCLKSYDCVIDRISQPNAVKCTRKDIKSAAFWGTTEMIRNCSIHLIAELGKLKPNLVVFHGINLPWIFLPLLEKLRIDCKEVADITDQQGKKVLYYASGDTLSIHMLFLAHPSHRWLDKQWESVVIPSLQRLRDLHVIPM